MKKLFYFVLSIIFSTFALASNDDAELIKCQNLAKRIKPFCIDQKPDTPAKEQACQSLFNSYHQSLVKLNDGREPELSEKADPTYRSPFRDSSYDVCKWETARLAIYFYCELGNK